MTRCSLLSGVFLILAAHGAARASCEDTIHFRSASFEMGCNEIAAYALRPRGEDAVADSIYDAGARARYDRLARCLAIATQIHRCERARAALLAASSGPDARPFWMQQGQGRSLQVWRPTDRDPQRVHDDTLLEVARTCLEDSFASLYAVQVARFPKGADPCRATATLAALVVPESHYAASDSMPGVDWTNDACWGSRRPDLYFLSSEKAPGSSLALYYGLFVDEAQARAVLDALQARYGLPTAVVVPVRVTGPVLLAALQFLVRR